MEKVGEIPPLISALLKVAEQFRSVHGHWSRTYLSKEMFGSGRKLDDLAAGRVSITLRRYERAVEWLIDNWPAGVPVSDDLRRIEDALFLREGR